MSVLCYNRYMAKQSWEEKQVSLGGAIIAGVITLVVGFFVGINWSNFAPHFLPYLGVQTRTAHDWSALDEVYNALQTNFDGEIDQNLLIEGAKKGMTDALGDVYTSYMSPEEARDYEDVLHGNIGAGVGIEMALREGYVRVVRVLPDNPAIRAGVKAGDIIYKVDGEEVYDQTTEQISNKLRGDAGTDVILTVVRERR